MCEDVRGGGEMELQRCSGMSVQQIFESGGELALVRSEGGWRRVESFSGKEFFRLREPMKVPTSWWGDCFPASISDSVTTGDCLLVGARRLLNGGLMLGATSLVVDSGGLLPNAAVVAPEDRSIIPWCCPAVRAVGGMM